MSYEYSILQKLLISFINSISSLAMLPSIFLLKYQKKTFSYIIGYFSLIINIMYHFSESLEISIFLDNFKWHELNNITGVYCFIQILIPLTKFHHDIDNLSKKNYFIFFIILLFQQRGPWDIENIVIPVVVDFLIEIYIIIKYGLPDFNTSIFLNGIIFLIISIFCFYKGSNASNDYLRIWHSLWQFFASITSFFIFQIQQNEYIGIIQIIKYFIENDDENDGKKFINLSKGYEEYLENFSNNEDNSKITII